MQTKLYLGTALIAVSQFSCQAEPLQKDQPGRPNIILIFADDLGYADVGCFGSKLAPTPNIDKLAAEGIRFTDGYVVAPVCAPSRLGMMTGLYPQRLGGFSNSTSRRATIPADHLLMPQMLRNAGYMTAHIGKWNINRPAKAVFDTVFNEIDWEADYLPGPDGSYHGMETGDIGSSKQQGWSKEMGIPYITDLHGDSAVKFIKNHSNKQQPFFLYLAFNAVHSPWQAPLELKAEYQNQPAEVLQLYSAMLHSLDQNVGKVLKQIENSGIKDNTLVIFLSDNGPAWGSKSIVGWQESWPEGILVGSADPLSGRKGNFLEGGIRIPFIMRWPAMLRAGTTYSHPVSSLDLYATFKTLSGSNQEINNDGVNLIPYLTGENKEDPHKILFWGGPGTVYARMGDWKIVVPENGSEPSLFNLSRDIGENQNVASQNPFVVDQMVYAVNNWKLEIKQ